MDDEKFGVLSKDDREKVMYCFECFADGKFREPALTIKDMKKKIGRQCKELGFNKLTTFVYQQRLSNLERWLPRFRWK